MSSKYYMFPWKPKVWFYRFIYVFLSDNKQMTAIQSWNSEPAQIWIVPVRHDVVRQLLTLTYYCCPIFCHLMATNHHICCGCGCACTRGCRVNCPGGFTYWRKNLADRLGSVCHGKLNCSAEPSLWKEPGCSYLEFICCLKRWQSFLQGRVSGKERLFSQAKPFIFQNPWGIGSFKK